MDKKYYFNKFEKNSKENTLKNIITYKDIFIILSLWYLIYFFTNIINQIEITRYSPQLEGLLEYLFFVSGRLLFIALTLFYFITLYGFTLSDLKIRYKINFKLFLQIMLIILIFSIAIVFLINIPLSLNEFSSEKFSPLYKIKSPDDFVNSLFTASFFFIINIIISIGEILVLINIIRPFLNKISGRKTSIILSCLFYPTLIMAGTYPNIIQYIILATIFFFIVKKTDSIIIPALLGASYYTMIFIYIYGWNLFFLK